jgi:imidazolonepropionase-like amidohydrolase
MPIATFLRCVTKFLLLASLIGSFVRLSAASAAAGEAQPLLIRDVRLFDGHRVFEHRSVLVAGGIIRAIGGPDITSRGAQLIDGRGKTLLPGIIDSHVHVPHANTEEALKQSARLGVTTDIDMFTDQPTLKTIKRLERADQPGMADIRSAGVGVSAPGGEATQMEAGLPTVSSPSEVEAFVAARVREGSDFIKIILEDNSEFGSKSQPMPNISADTLRAAVEAGHRHGKRVFVHVQTEHYARLAISAGADGLAHLFVGSTVSPDFGRYAAAHHIVVIPTLTTEYLRCGRSNGAAVANDKRLMPQTFGAYTSMLSQARSNSGLSCAATDEGIKELRDAHVPILVGTDAPVPGSTYGASTLDEMALLVADGLTPVEALIAGTSAPAKAFHLDDRGEIWVGKRADLVLVDGDPTRYIDAVKNISAVWKRGIPVQRLAPAPAKPAS